MATSTEAGTQYAIRAVKRVCDILDVLHSHPEGVSLADVAESTELPKSSVFRYLSALEARRYVERDHSGAFFRLGVAFRPDYAREVDVLVECARLHLERLRDALGETTNLGVLDGADVTHVLVVESPHMMRLAARVGEHGALHTTALGKAMAAELSEERLRTLLGAADFSPKTDRAIASKDEFLAEIERVRESRYGVDDCENQPDGRCVAVALRGLPFSAGISVSAPATRLPGEEVPAVARRLRHAADRISKQYLAGRI